jgi:ubiquinone/menaquinone biosynthesis C-methylase UbiE
MNLVRQFFQRDERLRRTLRGLANAPGATVLDVGCRSGELSESLAVEKQLLVGVDVIAYERWRHDWPNLVFACADATSLPFADEAFDLVVSGECLQYVSDWRRAIDEFHRVLKPGGILVFSCPNGNGLNDLFDAYNVNARISALLRGRSAKLVTHVRRQEVLSFVSTRWSREVAQRRGSLAFIYASFLIDNIQAVRRRQLQRGRWSARIVAPMLAVAVRCLCALMVADFQLPLGPLSYNSIYRFRKTEN